MGEENKKRLEQQLWNIANELRGKMDADEFRDYILGFIFYKYLSEKIEDYANDLLVEDGIVFTELDCTNNEEHQEMCEAIKEDAIEQLGYFLKPSELFSAMAKKGNGEGNNFILEDLTAVLRHIEQSTMGHASEDDFEHLFEDLDLTSTKLGRTEEAKNTLISKVLYHLDSIDFELKNHDRDVLGDAYEYLIGKFASGAGKKAGEFYTPQEVSKVLAKIVTTKKSKLKSVYDPTCGSGSLLLRVSKEVEDVSNFYGQELNRTTFNLARMNMIMHDVHYRKFDIKQEDTLENPQHMDDRFEAIVANPPFSANWSANPLHMNDDRFSQYGKLAPSSKADFAFVQHMIHHLDDNGTMAIVLPHGVLFRGSAEGHIRKYLIEDRNYLDAVIGLPSNIFYGTSIPTCILVFKKCREDSENVLFIDASKHFEKAKNQNYLREEDIDKIISTYQERKVEDKYSHLAPLDEIKENDYNLNIPRYVDTFLEEELVDLDEVSSELKVLEIDMTTTDESIAKFCDELGIATPF
jgi:type I restriction enzyme M protein